MWSRDLFLKQILKQLADHLGNGNGSPQPNRRQGPQRGEGVGCADLVETSAFRSGAGSWAGQRWHWEHLPLHPSKPRDRRPQWAGVHSLGRSRWHPWVLSKYWWVEG